ncbi:winged helix-turn-helix transcriptional regulator [Nonomuraea turcica]|uniref:winged helix-turn-helix transcriptional regulator n=1 Tax=Nonomuraea sp. G32 TaxID=3067274 RepID=UPI00273AD22B|nr:helix-turn-helix domain-containing protein [Nonomuraea sp. G32]MDP4506935.1 helix-turn-helix domain-containing protein [Nonomuraea sp. G32]
MAGKRSYGDGCAIAHALELVGERWALLVVRELILGPKRFTDLRAGLPGISADILTQRLRELEEAGIVQRRKLSPPAGSWIYELTGWGAELEPIVTDLARWSSRSPALPHDVPLSADSAALSLKALFAPAVGEALDLTVGLRLGEHHFLLRLDRDRLHLARVDSSPAQADLVIETSPRALAAVLGHARTLDDVLTTGDLTLTGPRATAERFLRLFPPPEPVTEISARQG